MSPKTGASSGQGGQKGGGQWGDGGEPLFWKYHKIKKKSKGIKNNQRWAFVFKISQNKRGMYDL